jgi:hypothetical protein
MCLMTIMNSLTIWGWATKSKWLFILPYKAEALERGESLTTSMQKFYDARNQLQSEHGVTATRRSRRGA